jgi:hypothetical protein
MCCSPSETDQCWADRSLPSFFAVGPPRTGTTWLYEVLKEHANLPRYTNELRFFDTHYSKGLRWYFAQFGRPTSAVPTGEICSTYFYSAQARQRIAALVPNAKIICTFRDPAERIFSLYRAKCAGGIIPFWNFEEALRGDPELLESARYAFHLSQWQALFGKDGVLAMIYEGLMHDPQEYIDRIAGFVVIPRFQLSARHIRPVNSFEGIDAPRIFLWTHVAAAISDWLKVHRGGPLVTAVKRSALRRLVLGGGPQIPQLDPDAADRLRGLLRAEVTELEKMTGLDLSAWEHSRTR